MLNLYQFVDDLIAFFKANKDKQINGQNSSSKRSFGQKFADLTVLPGDESRLDAFGNKKIYGRVISMLPRLP